MKRTQHGGRRGNGLTRIGKLTETIIRGMRIAEREIPLTESGCEEDDGHVEGQTVTEDLHARERLSANNRPRTLADRLVK
jgi:hypothetical protein